MIFHSYVCLPDTRGYEVISTVGWRKSGPWQRCWPFKGRSIPSSFTCIERSSEGQGAVGSWCSRSLVETACVLLWTSPRSQVWRDYDGLMMSSMGLWCFTSKVVVSYVFAFKVAHGLGYTSLHLPLLSDIFDHFCHTLRWLNVMPHSEDSRI